MLATCTSHWGTLVTFGVINVGFPSRSVGNMHYLRGNVVRVQYQHAIFNRERDIRWVHVQYLYEVCSKVWITNEGSGTR